MRSAPETTALRKTRVADPHEPFVKTTTELAASRLLSRTYDVAKRRCQQWSCIGGQTPMTWEWQQVQITEILIKLPKRSFDEKARRYWLSA
jgi:hypothetical protein